MFLQGEGCSVLQGSVRGYYWRGQWGRGVSCAFSPPPWETILGPAARHSLHPWRKQKPEQLQLWASSCDSCGSRDSERSSQSRRSFSGQGSDSNYPLPGLLTMLSKYQSHARVHGSPGEPGGAHLFSLNNCLPHKAGSGYRLRPHLGEVSIGFITDASRSSLGEMKGLQRYSGGLLGTLDSSLEQGTRSQKPFLLSTADGSCCYFIFPFPWE